MPDSARHAILYLDDSGDRRVPGSGSSTNHFVLAGMILDATKSVRAYRAVDRLISRYGIEDEWGQRATALHCYDMVHKKGYFRGWTEEKCKKLSDDVWSAIAGLEPTCVGTVVRKRRFLDRYEQPDDTLLYALGATLTRYDLYLTGIDSLGHVVLDTQSDRDTKAVHKRFLHWRTWGTGYSARTPAHLNRRLTRIIDTVSIVPDQNSAGVQLADWIAYSTLANFEHGWGRRFQQYRGLWRKVGGFQEPSVIPK